MKGRRTAAMLCVLLGHALVVFMLMSLTRTKERPRLVDLAGEMFFISEPLVDDQDEDRSPRPRDSAVQLERPEAAGIESASEAAAAGEPANVDQGFVDWPKEGHDAAARVLAREAETERVAKLFAGPQGTWASLTKRQQSELNHFRWKPGIDGMERDERGNTVFHVSEGCTLVNFTMIACALGKKPPAYGDLFKDMRRYFDEQRLPRTDEGNGREPESLRPPSWSKPLGDKDP